MHAATILTLVAIGTLTAACDGKPTTAKRAVAEPAHVESARQAFQQRQEQQRQELATRCTIERAQRLQAYKDHIAKADHWRAFLAVSQCADALQDPEMQAMADEAETRTLIAQITDKKLSASERLQSLERLRTLAPDQAGKYAHLQPSLASKKTAAEALNKSEAQLSRVYAIEHYISIGMAADQVLARLGKPVNVNRTTTVNGTAEQWVYPSGRYVYMRDGRVTGIQSGS